ncbi:RbsD/FucU domain-containing protein [Cellulomonas sp. 73-92]|uniref:RbsD/FucU domain-containing protein n=1 Tax=Cellulomonas sp. 73-92 TaxID=1895740 RepID=UPI000B118349|nr:RbsD/FucU domain-containing protein [Cellulomonas sp. 73-92]
MVLAGIHPLLTGTLLHHLDAMGHGDCVLVSDAHFPAERLAQVVVDMPGVDADVIAGAICTVLPLDTLTAAVLMDPEGAEAPAVAALRRACPAPTDAIGMLPRQAFYDTARRARVAVRSGDRRTFGNVLLFKGVVA